MWMQVLEAAGLPTIGEAFPLDWEQALGSLNRGGFYESTLRDGINFTSNPSPSSGVYLHPHETRCDVIKVFAEGVVQSDFAFLDRVLVSVRPWRAYAASIERLWAVEDEARDRDPRDCPPRLHGALEWWRANYGLIRDVAMRRYAVHFQSWPATLRAPHEVVPSVLQWLSSALPDDAPPLNVEAAVAVVDAGRASCADPPSVECDLPTDALASMDLLFEALDQGQGLSAELVARLNDTHEQLEPFFVEFTRAHAAWMAANPGGGATLLSL